MTVATRSWKTGRSCAASMRFAIGCVLELAPPGRVEDDRREEATRICLAGVISGSMVEEPEPPSMDDGRQAQRDTDSCV